MNPADFTIAGIHRLHLHPIWNNDRDPASGTYDFKRAGGAISVVND